MNKMELFERTLTYQERQVLDTLDSPSRIQSFLDSVEYPSSEENRSCVEVLRQRKAHFYAGSDFRLASSTCSPTPAVMMTMYWRFIRSKVLGAR